jgi:hypothetical protein
MPSQLAFLGVEQHHISPKSFFQVPHKGKFQQHASCTAQQQSNSNATATRSQHSHNASSTLLQIPKEESLTA